MEGYITRAASRSPAMGTAQRSRAPGTTRSLTMKRKVAVAILFALLVFTAPAVEAAPIASIGGVYGTGSPTESSTSSITFSSGAITTTPDQPTAFGGAAF